MLRRALYDVVFAGAFFQCIKIDGRHFLTLYRAAHQGARSQASFAIFPISSRHLKFEFDFLCTESVYDLAAPKVPPLSRLRLQHKARPPGGRNPVVSRNRILPVGVIPEDIPERQFMLLLLIILVFLLLSGGGYYGYRQQYYSGGGFGLLGVVLLILLVLVLFGGPYLGYSYY
jgi:hypothetical protein